VRTCQRTVTSDHCQLKARAKSPKNTHITPPP
jgi:hypothetical protein